MAIPLSSPSMDIQVSSNFERLLFELLGRDGQKTASYMQEFSRTGQFTVAENVLQAALQDFSGFCLDDEGTSEEIARCYRDEGYLIDPHSAVGLAAAGHARSTQLIETDTPIISLACAHPAKFPDAVFKASGQHPALPESLSDLMEREEHMLTAKNDMAAIQQLLLERQRG